MLHEDVALWSLFCTGHDCVCLVFSQALMFPALTQLYIAKPLRL